MFRSGGWQAEVGEELRREYHDRCKISHPGFKLELFLPGFEMTVFKDGLVIATGCIEAGA